MGEAAKNRRHTTTCRQQIRESLAVAAFDRAVCRVTVPFRLCLCAACAAEVAYTEGAEGEVAAPQKTKEELEAQQEEQLNALRVLYAAQHAVKYANESCGTAPCGGDAKPKFDELMKNITFPKSGGFLGGDGAARKKALDSVICNSDGGFLAPISLEDGSADAVRLRRRLCRCVPAPTRKSSICC